MWGFPCHPFPYARPLGGSRNPDISQSVFFFPFIHFWSRGTIHEWASVLIWKITYQEGKVFWEFGERVPSLRRKLEEKLFLSFSGYCHPWLQTILLLAWRWSSHVEAAENVRDRELEPLEFNTRAHLSFVFQSSRRPVLVSHGAQPWLPALGPCPWIVLKGFYFLSPKNLGWDKKRLFSPQFVDDTTEDEKG